MADLKPAGPLFLAGLGLCDENDLPSRSLEALKGCESVFSESYTSLMREGTLERLEKKIGRKIKVLSREEVENEKIILDACSFGPAALLVPGDAMSATTHNSLVESARKKGIQANILHASSIFTAAPGSAGLQMYKMGKTATIAYWRKGYEPTAFIDIIAQNLARGAHTLCLLDIDPQLGCMKPSLALELMEKAQKKKMEDEGWKEPALKPDCRFFILSRVGWPEQKMWAGKREEWNEKMDEKLAGPCAIIVIGKTHFAEEESYERVRGQK